SAAAPADPTGGMGGMDFLSPVTRQPFRTAGPVHRHGGPAFGLVKEPSVSTSPAVNPSALQRHRLKAGFADSDHAGSIQQSSLVNRLIEVGRYE
ncbi:hypothetical protein ABZV91_15545, partial [Nocardia sp. NPDC004568]|uniref:hypothetical protein n=1 Tax=Nocardia sp. NPDC004568 TaxID=3154551 RepID=UPI0033BAB0B3